MVKYNEITFRQKVLKTFKKNNKRKSLLMVPKCIIFIFIILSYDSSKSTDHTGLSILKSSELFTTESIQEFNNMNSDLLQQNLQFYALIKLKYKSHDSFFRYLLLLSGDINLNPGPECPCIVCQKKLH